MTNSKLGVLLVDVPEPRFFKYYLVKLIKYNKEIIFDVTCCDTIQALVCNAYKCTQEEAKKYPQFRWVALEEL